MKKLIQFSICAAVAATLVVCSSAHAQSQHPMARFLDTNTIGFARVDLKTLDVDSFQSKLESLAKGHKALSSRGTLVCQTMKSFQSTLVDAGVDEIYMFLSLSDMLSGPYFVIPADRDQIPKINQVVQILPLMNRTLKIHRVGEGILVSSQSTFQRLKDGFLPVRKDASEILQLATQDADLIIAPSKDQLKAIRDSIGPPYPTFAGTIFTEGHLDGDLIADGMQRIHLALTSRPSTLRLHVQGGEGEAGAKATQQVAAKVNEAVNIFRGGEIPFIPKTWDPVKVPTPLSSAVSNIEIKQQGNQLLIEMDENRFDSVAKALVASMGDQVGTTSRRHRIHSARSLVLGAHNYYDAYRKFPQNVVDEDGKPLLSWRVQLLPFLEEGELYSKFKMDEPWDSEHNKALIAEMPDFLKTDDKLSSQGKTIWSVPKGDAFMGSVKTFDEIIDGTSNTIMILGTTADAAVTWTQPTDWAPDINDIKKGVFSETQTKAIFARVDGSTGTMTSDITDEALLWFLGYADGKIVDSDAIK